MLHNRSKEKSYSGRIILIATSLALGYAVLRYHIIGTVPWKDLSLYVLNKGISLASIILLTINFTLGPLKNMGLRIPEHLLNSRKSIGISGFLLALIHVFFSYLLLNPLYYSGFFVEDGTFSTLGSISLMGGIFSFILIWIYNISFKTYLREDKRFIKFITSRRFLVYAMLFTGIHLFFLGYTGWLTPFKWPGGLPPISLISFLFFLTGFVTNLIGRK